MNYVQDIYWEKKLVVDKRRNLEKRMNLQTMMLVKKRERGSLGKNSL